MTIVKSKKFVAEYKRLNQKYKFRKLELSQNAKRNLKKSRITPKSKYVNIDDWDKVMKPLRIEAVRRKITEKVIDKMITEVRRKKRHAG